MTKDAFYFPHDSGAQTFTTEGSWGEAVIDMEEIRLMCWFIEREKADRELKTRALMSKLRMCPLLIRIYGSWEGAFGLDPPEPAWKNYSPKIELSKSGNGFEITMPIFLATSLIID